MLVKKFITQVRKQGVDLFIATQKMRQIDVRVRENAEIIGQCRKFAVKNRKLVTVSQSKQYDETLPIIVELMKEGNEKLSNISSNQDEMINSFDKIIEQNNLLIQLQKENNNLTKNYTNS